MKQLLNTITSVRIAQLIRSIAGITYFVAFFLYILSRL